jgi:hypothetical protein
VEIASLKTTFQLQKNIVADFYSLLLGFALFRCRLGGQF